MVRKLFNVLSSAADREREREGNRNGQFGEEEKKLAPPSAEYIKIYGEQYFPGKAK